MWQKIKCALGFHKMWPENSNIETAEMYVFRTYMRCTVPKCRKVGKIVYYKEVKK